jgi:archaellum component FlaG (FlaF/FlaG flagellin family)
MGRSELLDFVSALILDAIVRSTITEVHAHVSSTTAADKMTVGAAALQTDAACLLVAIPGYMGHSLT